MSTKQFGLFLMAIALPTFQTFDLHPRETAPLRFERYVKRLENLFEAMSMTDANRRKALFLHYAGEPANDVYDTLDVPEVTTTAVNPETDNVFKCAVRAFKEMHRSSSVRISQRDTAGRRIHSRIPYEISHASKTL